MKSRALTGVLLATALMLGIAGCVRDENQPGATQEESRSGDTNPDSSAERLITILQTNDIHGSVDSQTTNSGDAQGGMAFFGGVVRSIREGLARRFGRNAGVLVLDAGDQFQGTLLSNYGEGQVVYATMNQVGYDAVTPGNHAFDFGPIGWLEDQVTSGTADQNPKGALYRLVRQANFPLLSANTYARESLVDLNGEKVAVNGIGCKPMDESRILDWSRASQPDFIRPYVLREVADLRVAIIGLDNIQTPQTTTSANVSDICFRDQVESYLEFKLRRPPPPRTSRIFAFVTRSKVISKPARCSKEKPTYSSRSFTTAIPTTKRARRSSRNNWCPREARRLLTRLSPGIRIIRTV